MEALFINEKLKNDLSNDEYIFNEIRKSRINEENENFYQFIINYLTSLELTEEEAKNHYYKILEHKYYLSEKMQRDIGLRVATLDYFLNVAGLLKNPKFIEIDLFEKLLKTSREDPKTNCFNSNFLYEFGEKEIKRAERWGQNLSIILIDLDNFKALNDTFGHLFGDKILRKFVNIVKKNIRKEDILTRFGGDEFAILLPQTGRIGARCLAERIRNSLVNYIDHKCCEGKSVNLTFSCGISTYPFDGNSVQDLLNKADIALYKAKYLGKNRIFDYLEEEYLKNKENIQERRQYTRYKVNSNSKVLISINNDLFDIEGKIVDISFNGVLLEFNCRITQNIIGKNIAIKIDNVNGYKVNDSYIQANVARVNVENNNLRFYLGVRLQNLIDNNTWKVFENFGNLTAA